MSIFEDILEAARARAVQADITATNPDDLPGRAEAVGRILGWPVISSEPISPIILAVQDVRVAHDPGWEPRIVGVTQRWAYYLDMEAKP